MNKTNNPFLERADVLFAGDTLLRTKNGAGSPFSEDVIDLFKRSSCVLLNLETAVSEMGRSKEKSMVINAAPDMVRYLKEAGVHAVNLANNHTMDYGVQGFRSTLASLDAAGIGYFGAVRHGEQRPFRIELDGCRIGVLGYADCGAQEHDIGIAPINEGQIKRDIRELKNDKVDRVIISLHWGEEFVPYPSPGQQRIAREVIDHGADVILGHHPHTIQGIERYKNGTIFYSLGNFNFSNSNPLYQRFPDSRWGTIALMLFSRSLPLEYSSMPVLIDSEYRPFLAPEADEKVYRTYLCRISEVLNPKVRKLFWLREASTPYFKNHIPSYIRRIRKFGLRHCLQMLIWMINPRNYGFYLGFLLKLMDRAIGRSSEEPYCPETRR